MQDTFAKVKPSIDLVAGVAFSNVIIKDGQMMGSNGHMSVGIPFESELNYAVNADLLDKALRVLPNPKVKFDEKGCVIFTQGKSRSKLSVTDLKDVWFAKPDDDLERIPLPASFSSNLKLIMPFIGDDHINLWQVGAICFNGYVYATTGRYMIGLECDLKNNFTLPDRAVAYILKRKERAVAYGLSEKYVALFFEDNTWLRISRLTDERVESCKKVFDMAFVEPTFEINHELRDAVTQAVQVAGDEIQISPEGVWTYKDSSDFFVECATGVKTTTSWSPAMLEQCFSLSTHMDLDPVPAPATFNGSMDGLPAAFKGARANGLLTRRKPACVRALS